MTPMRLILLAILALQAAPAQSEADKLEAALKKFGDRKYRVTEGGKPTGTMTLKTRIEVVGDRKEVVLEDRLERKIGDAVETVTITETSNLEGLALVRADLTATTAKGEVKATASIREGDAYISGPDGILMLIGVEGGMGILAPPRILCMKKQEVGAHFNAEVILWNTPSDNQSHEFRCVSKESIEVGGKKVEAFKWEVRWTGDLIKGGKQSSEKTYWIAPDGALLRFKTASTEMVLESK